MNLCEVYRAHGLLVWRWCQANFIVGLREEVSSQFVKYVV
jgi:hypothetical protein